MTTLSPDPGRPAPPSLASPDPGGPDEPDGAALGGIPNRPRRRRLALWLAGGALVVVAILIAVLAAAGPASEQLTQSPLLGKPAPELHGSAILNGPAGGGPVNLASYRGKWVLVNFAASWCVPCQEEMPQLLLFAKQHQAVGQAGGHSPGNAAIVTVAYDPTDIGNLRRFLAERSVGWATVDDSQAPIDWGVTGLPDSYVVDPEGTVVAKVEGQVNAAELDRLIAKYSPAPGKS